MCGCSGLSALPAIATAHLPLGCSHLLPELRAAQPALLTPRFACHSQTLPLQGGLYAPSIFIGAALGTAFGLMAHAVGDPLGMTLAAPQAYALVGECLPVVGHL